MTAPLIALVDDDKNILATLSIALEAAGFMPRLYSDGEAALEGFAIHPPDLAVLDIKMPRMDGMTLLQEIRKKWAFPVIFLTSKDEEVDALLAFRLGADDYVTKPFSPRLLLARIEACLRRHEFPKAPQNDPQHITCGALALDDARHECTLKGQKVDLTVTEYLLLRTLAMRPGHVRTRTHLIDAAYGPGTYIDDRTIDSHIKRVRQKLRGVDPDFESIETLYGLGYRYREEGPSHE